MSRRITYVCPHCRQEIGEITEDVDSYDLMVSHVDYCDSDKARAVRKARDEEG